jgi:hypothetical protein
VLLDALVHGDMLPFEPMIEGSALYMGAEAMFPISALLVLPLAWLIALCVSAAQGFASRRLAQSQTIARSA